LRGSGAGLLPLARRGGCDPLRPLDHACQATGTSGLKPPAVSYPVGVAFRSAGRGPRGILAAARHRVDARLRAALRRGVPAGPGRLRRVGANNPSARQGRPRADTAGAGERRSGARQVHRGAGSASRPAVQGDRLEGQPGRPSVGTVDIETDRAAHGASRSSQAGRRALGARPEAYRRLGRVGPLPRREDRPADARPR